MLSNFFGKRISSKEEKPDFAGLGIYLICGSAGCSQAVEVYYTTMNPMRFLSDRGKELYHS